MNVKDWQTTLNKAFSLARPRNVRFQFFTDHDEWERDDEGAVKQPRVKREGAGSIGLWRQGGTMPKDCEIEVVEGLVWYGFSNVNVPHDVTPESALKMVKALFTRF